MAFVARASAPALPGIKKVSVKHEAILDFLLANPLVKMRVVAQHFEVSQTWLSLVIHSDAFQRLLRQRQDCHFDSSILPAMDKLRLATDLALESLIRELPTETDVGKLNQVVDKGLDRLGYGTSHKFAPTSVNVQVNVDRETLANARALIGAGPPRPALEDQRHDALGYTAQVQEGRESAVGEAVYEATFPLEAPADAAGENGDQV
jgi:hypothetical protein